MELEKICKFVHGIIEGRDPELSDHHYRVSQYALSFADQVGLSDDDARVLSIGAGIHDVGKMSISESILNKPARLTAVEFSMVQQHTLIGSQLLDPLNLDPRITEIARYHHENFDGSGYPEGKPGKSIPLMARMIRILDSFDALTQDRPYHKKVSHYEATEVMKKDSHCYDPELLKVFCGMFEGPNPLTDG